EDFMRAVVLPQGKFLELLHLKGSERRQMLQRVFRLHAYGGRLRRQISSRQQAAEQAMAAVQGELKGLGEATDEALAQAREHAEAARSKRQGAQKALETRREAVEQTQRLRREHARLAEARRELAAHRAGAPEIAVLEAQLASSRALEPILMPLERWSGAREHHRACRSEYDAAVKQARGAERAWSRAREAAAAVERDDQAQRPRWVQQARELESLEAAAEARAALERDLSAATDERARHESAIETAVSASAEADERLSELDDKRRGLRRRLRQRRVRADEREQATAAAEAADRLERARAEEQAARDAVVALQQREASAEAAHTDARVAASDAEQAYAEVQAEHGPEPHGRALEAYGARLRALVQMASGAAESDAEAARQVVEQVHTSRVALEQARAPATLAEGRLADLREARAVAEARLDAARSDEAKAWEAFHAQRGDLTLFDVHNALVALASRDREAEALQRELDAVDAAWSNAAQTRDVRKAEESGAREQLVRLDARLAMLEARRASLASPAGDLTAAHAQVQQAVAMLDAAVATARQGVETANQAHREADNALATVRGRLDAAERALRGARGEVLDVLRSSVLWSGPPDIAVDADVTELDERIAAVVEHWRSSGPDLPDPAAAVARVDLYRETERGLEACLAALDDGSAPEPEALSDETLQALEAAADEATATLEAAVEAAVAARRDVDGIVERMPRVRDLEEQLEALDREATQLSTLAQVMRGDRFVEYVANDHLTELATRASEHLGTLTDGRYALALDDDTGFEIVDHHGGGAVRPVHTLSGGESFLTALSLALALSTQVQARSARPLGFFFLDEGFGTLDPEALDRVMSSIEQLRDDNRVIGLISHVPSIRERVPRYLWVHRPDDAEGSSVELRDN
ncbi:MAG: SbcC/MukB-like Walker B domain-containing protein, partial [Myxococcota bacterium]